MAKVWKSHREESRIDYGKNKERDEGPTREELNVGALLRIADSLEIITKEKRDLISYYEHRITGLKGYIKRMKK